MVKDTTALTSEYMPGDLRFEPEPCRWYPITHIYSALGWYVVVNDPLAVHSPRPYMTFVDYGQSSYWDAVIAARPNVQFMFVTFPKQDGEVV